MKVIKRKWPIFLACSVFVIGGLFFLLRPVPSGKSAAPKQAILPSEGWVVCGDLGIGSPPGAPGNVQLMLLCAGNDWEVRAFCLEPAEPAPPLGAGCSLVGGVTFWCGEQYQLLQLYQIQQTPAPTNTLVPTNTYTPIPTNTPRPPNTPSPTFLPIPSLTPRQPTVTLAPDTQPTVFVRPSAGGPGNLLPVASVLALAAGLALLVAARRR